MPQKKNADSLELIRGKSGRIFGRVSERKQTNVTAVAACHLKTSESEFGEILRHFLTRQQASYNIISIFFCFQCAGMQMTLKVKLFSYTVFFPSWLNSFFCIRGANKSLCSVRENHKGHVTRGDSQRGFLAQHRIVMLEQCCNNSKQCCNAVLG